MNSSSFKIYEAIQEALTLGSIECVRTVVGTIILSDNMNASDVTNNADRNRGIGGSLLWSEPRIALDDEPDLPFG